MRCGIVVVACIGCNFATCPTSDKNMHHAWVSHDIILNAPPFFSKLARADASCGASNRGLDAGVLGGIVFWFGHFTSNARHCLFPQTSRESHACKFLGGVVVLSPIAVADMAAKHLLLATLACQFLCGHAGFIFPHHMPN